MNYLGGFDFLLFAGVVTNLGDDEVIKVDTDDDSWFLDETSDDDLPALIDEHEVLADAVSSSLCFGTQSVPSAASAA